jgi:hypothetical protein
MRLITSASFGAMDTTLILLHLTAASVTIKTILEELDIVVSETIPDADTLVVESGAKAQSTSAEAAVAALARNNNIQLF